MAAFMRSWTRMPAWLLLSLTTLMWAGNSVASRAIAGHMSPMTVVTARWLIVCAVLVPWLQRDLASFRQPLTVHWRRIALMGLFGFTGFNALFYVAAHYTGAVNLTLLQSAIPAFVLAGSAVLFRTRIGTVQVAGMLLTLLGVGLVATRGEPGNFLSLTFNIGDVMVIVACLFYAGYTLALRHRPPMPGLVLFTAMALVALISSLPLLATEMAAGQTFWPTPTGWMILVYISIFPSLLSQLFYIRSVELIGPGRAGIFTNLVPVFGAILAVALLGEEFRAYHALALMLALGGIWLSERMGQR